MSNFLARALFDSNTLYYYHPFWFFGDKMRLFSIFLSVFLVPIFLFGGYSHVGNKWSPEQYVPLFPVQEHFDRGYQAFNKNLWDEALAHFMVIAYHYDETPFYPDAIYYSGICYFFKKELDVCNKQFNRYLDLPGKLKHFEKVFEFKLEVANRYAKGSKKHIFGFEKLPKWSSAKKDALELYDEIIAALPGKEVSAQALYQKADLLRSKRHFQEAIESLQTLSRRFPKHTLAAEAFLRVSEIYLEESRIESQNPDLIALAQVNLQRFLKSFPLDDRIDQARKNIIAMQEVYALSLYDTGRFYERKKKPNASLIYYADTIRKYPGTQAAAKSQERLAKLSIDPHRAV